MAAGQPRLQDTYVRDAQRRGCPAEAHVRTRSGDVMRQDTCGEGTLSVGQHIIPVSHNHASATMLSVGNPLRLADAGSCAHGWRCRAQRDGQPKGSPTPQRRASNSQGARQVVRPLQGDLARRPSGSPLQQHDIRSGAAAPALHHPAWPHYRRQTRPAGELTHWCPTEWSPRLAVWPDRVAG